MGVIEHIKEFIKGHNIMVLATSDNSQPYACTVFYVTSDSKTLYFKSYVATQHVKVLKSNPNVGIVIYDKESSPSTEKQGIQILGNASRIDDIEEATKAVELFISNFNTPREKLYPIENLIGDSAVSSMYRVDIEKVKMLDSKNHIEPNEYLDIY